MKHSIIRWSVVFSFIALVCTQCKDNKADLDPATCGDTKHWTGPHVKLGERLDDGYDGDVRWYLFAIPDVPTDICSAGYCKVDYYGNAGYNPGFAWKGMASWGETSEKAMPYSPTGYYMAIDSLNFKSKFPGSPEKVPLTLAVELRFKTQGSESDDAYIAQYLLYVQVNLSYNEFVK